MIMMNDKLHNLLNDPNVQFFLVATPHLKALITANEHPHIKQLGDTAKAELLSGNAIVLDKQDVEDFVLGKLAENGAFLFKNGDIRVVGVPAIAVSQNNKGS
jgi:hypothetical protein